MKQVFRFPTQGERNVQITWTYIFLSEVSTRLLSITCVRETKLGWVSSNVWGTDYAWRSNKFRCASTDIESCEGRTFENRVELILVCKQSVKIKIRLLCQRRFRSPMRHSPYLDQWKQANNPLGPFFRISHFLPGGML